jgi:hypothetical protein
MQHFLDEQENIPKKMPKEARELANYFSLVIDTFTKKLPAKLTSIDITCFEKGCKGTIRVEILCSSN